MIFSSRFELRWGEKPVPKSQQNLEFLYLDKDGKIIEKKDAFYEWKNQMQQKSKRESTRKMNCETSTNQILRALDTVRTETRWGGIITTRDVNRWDTTHARDERTRCAPLLPYPAARRTDRYIPVQGQAQ